MDSFNQGNLQQVPLTKDSFIKNIPMAINQAQPNERVASIVFLDTETTGFKPSAKIIELGMVRCTFSLDRKIILSVDRIFDSFEDPREPIPRQATGVHGITNKMVQGYSISDSEVQSFLADTALVTAHNATFDRPKFERRFPQCRNLQWVCSYKGINWKGLGFSCCKLESLVNNSGFFYHAHRAYTDCLAVCFLMIHHPMAFKMLLNNAL